MKQKFFMETMLSVLLALVIYFMVLAMSTKFKHEWDLTKDKTFTLAEQSVQAAKNAPGNVTIYAFIHGDQQKEQADRLLKRYHEANPDRVQVEVFDIINKPQLARKYKVKAPGTGVIVLDKGPSATPSPAPGNDTSEVDESRNEHFTGFTEDEVTNALLRLSRNAEIKVYALTGHGERSLDAGDPESLTILKADMAREGFVMQPLSLAATGKIPEDCKVLLIAGPTNNPLPPEEKMIRDYLAKGGRMLLLLESDPETPQPWVKLANDYGVDASHNIVVDPMASQMGVDPVYSVSLVYDRVNPIVRTFNLPAKFKMARPLTQVKDAPKGDVVAPLASTAGSSFELPRSAVIGQSQLKVDPSKTPPSTSVLMMTSVMPSNLPAPPPLPGEKDKKKAPEMRVVVAGDADWISNALIRDYGNRDLVLNTFNWLAESENQISIRPKSDASTPMQMTDADRNRLTLVHMVLLPAFVALGALLSLKRQSS